MGPRARSLLGKGKRAPFPLFAGEFCCEEPRFYYSGGEAALLRPADWRVSRADLAGRLRERKGPAAGCAWPNPLPCPLQNSLAGLPARRPSQRAGPLGLQGWSLEVGRGEIDLICWHSSGEQPASPGWEQGRPNFYARSYLDQQPDTTHPDRCRKIWGGGDPEEAARPGI